MRGLIIAVVVIVVIAVVAPRVHFLGKWVYVIEGAWKLGNPVATE